MPVFFISSSICSLSLEFQISTQHTTFCFRGSKFIFSFFLVFLIFVLAYVYFLRFPLLAVLFPFSFTYQHSLFCFRSSKCLFFLFSSSSCSSYYSSVFYIPFSMCSSSLQFHILTPFSLPCPPFLPPIPLVFILRPFSLLTFPVFFHFL